jgi:outer membrane immunogenic protein
MKALITATATAAAALVALLPAAALAQTAGTTFYGTLGYDETYVGSVNLGAIQGRIGARFGRYFGVEGEVSGGVKSDRVGIAGTSAKVKLDNQEAVYGVGFLPLSPNFDLLARVGYGRTETSGSVAGVSAIGRGDSWNYGAGGQYTFDGTNGVRVDYTRESFQNSGAKDADVWAISYVRKF